MAHLIDKDALVAEIDNLLDKGRYHEEYDCAYRDGNNCALYALKGKLDTIEVKEIDFHKELLSFYRHTNDSGSEIALAKHFFELGIKAAQNEHKSCTTNE